MKAEFREMLRLLGIIEYSAYILVVAGAFCVLFKHGGFLSGSGGYFVGALCSVFAFFIVLSVRSMREDLKKYADSDRYSSALLLHDLKNPLTTIMMSISTTLKEVKNTQTEALLSLAMQSSQFQQWVMETAQDLDRIETGELRPEPHQIDLEQLVKICSEEARSMVYDKNINVNADVAKAAKIVADPAMLKNILVALLLYAMKYTPRSGEISLSAEQKRSEYVFKISDSGPQLEPRYMVNLFARCLGPGERRKHPRKSVGFGLSYARLAVEAHGGEIKAGNDKTKFTISFSIPQK